MQKTLTSAFILMLLAATSGQSLRASTQLDRIFSGGQTAKTKPEEVRDSSKGTSAVWPSTFEGQTEQFEGYFIATSPQTQLAVRSDDGVSVSKDGASLLSKVGNPQHWPDDSSFADLGGFAQNVPYKVVVDYKNTSFSGNDADGVTLMPYNGNGKLVTVNLVVQNGTMAMSEDREEKIPAYVALNDNWDAEQRNAAGEKIADNATSLTVLNTTDPDLSNATLQIAGKDETGQWKLSFPAGIRVWKSQNGNWEKVTSGTASANVTLPATIPLKIEGMALGNADVTASFQLTAPSSAQSIEDTAKVAVYKINLTAVGLKMGVDGYLVRAQTAACPELDEKKPGVFVHYNLDDDNHRQQPASVINSKHPNADYQETIADEREDDMLTLAIDILGLPDGKITLTTSNKIAVWMDKNKGDKYKLYSTKVWDLSQFYDKNEFKPRQRQSLRGGNRV